MVVGGGVTTSLRRGAACHIRHRDLQGNLGTSISVRGASTALPARLGLKISAKWQRLTMRDAIKKFAKIDYVDYPDTDSLHEAIRTIGSNAASDALWGKLIDGLLNAFSELNDPIDQEERFVEMGHAENMEEGEAHPLDEDYLRAMRYGIPPNGGFGMGIGRLTMLVLRELILKCDRASATMPSTQSYRDW